MIGVLSKDNDLDIVERTEIKGIEDLLPWRITHKLPVLVMDEYRQFVEILLIEFFGQGLAP